MRIEFNPRALCYNVYCDTTEEYEKLKELMQDPIKAVDWIEINEGSLKEVFESCQREES